MNFDTEHCFLSETWKALGKKPHHGFCIPLSSIHTQSSCGIGEIYDLIPLIDWMNMLGFDILQLLPINDSGLDNSPYNALSSCAINPIYLSLEKLPYLEKYPSLKKAIEPLKALTKIKFVDYLTVRTKKEIWVNAYLEQVEQLIMSSPAYQEYLKKYPWVTSYAHFVVLAKANHFVHWKDWIVQQPDPFQMERQKIVQYLLYDQLKHVKEYATEKKVFLMGDIPILVSSQSVDVWKNTPVFDLERSVGVPPDVFSTEGQAWGFPVFKWKEKEEECFQIWKLRLEYAENFYHIFRLDHIVGFFRLWVINNGQKAKEGSYIPSDVSEAIARGDKILETIGSFTSMLPVGEDLGVVLPEFREVLKNLGISGIKVMRWERFWDSGGQFVPLDQYPTLSLTCVSTHDTETLASWWNERPEESARYAELRGFPYQPMNFDIRRQYLKDSHQTSTIFHINLLNEYLALYPELVHHDLQDERINIPGTPPEKNWRYRMLKPLETILQHSDLKHTISSFIQ